ncbi:ion transporter [Clostridium sp. WILCCON 0269]|uniref:Ion transporter n=1 Tax=Candidatus Clostridium eludens TaxID=3381663 RepID=A0ABW8ST27_9CLOT
MNDTNHKKLRTIYNVTITLLSLAAVSLAFLDLSNEIKINLPPYNYINNCILIIFTIDYFIRFIIAKDKKNFFIKNIFDLIAIIPFSSFFRATRLFKIADLVKLEKFFRLIRLLTFLKKISRNIKNFLYTNGLIYLIYANILTITIGAFSIYIFEKGITVKSLSDSFWWSFVTATTVGYGDISPSTTPGRITAAVIMIMGIGLISLLTGTISTYFINKQNHHYKQISLKDDYKDLPEEALIEIEKFIEYIHHKYGKN